MSRRISSNHLPRFPNIYEDFSNVVYTLPINFTRFARKISLASCNVRCGVGVARALFPFFRCKFTMQKVVFGDWKLRYPFNFASLKYQLICSNASMLKNQTHIKSTAANIVYFCFRKNASKSVLSMTAVDACCAVET